MRSGSKRGMGLRIRCCLLMLQGDAGLTVLSDGDVMLTGPAVAGAEMTLRAGATSDGYLGDAVFCGACFGSEGV